MKTKNWTRIVLIVAVVMFLGNVAPAKTLNPGKIELPGKIKAVIAKLFPDADIEKIVEEMESYKVYEVEMTNDDEEQTVSIATDGTVLSVEIEMDAKDLPEAVQKALKTKLKNAKIVEVEKETIHAEMRAVKLAKPKTVYAAKYVIDGKEYEVAVTANGKVLPAEEPEKKAANVGKGKDEDDDNGKVGDDDDDDDDNGKVGDDDDDDDDNGKTGDNRTKDKDRKTTKVKQSDKNKKKDKQDND